VSPFSGFGRVAMDGEAVVFAATCADSSAGLYRVNLDGSGLERLVDTATPLPGGRLLIAPRLENWSLGAGNGDVVFEAGDPFGDHGIYLWRAGAVSRIIGNQGGMLDGRRVLETDLGPGCLSDGIVGFTAQTTGGRVVYLAHLPRGPVDPPGDLFAETLAPDALAALWSLLAWLERTEEGRRLIQLYLKHAGELLRLALVDAPLREGTVGTLEGFLPGLIPFLQGSGAEAVITADQVARLNAVWDGYLAAASPALAADLAAERARFHGFA
ncbi:MAG: hypothetical protein J0L84_07815, partial [Verrucomicrobia bacterium]|nr:hypothetical protein [Verrucomicrobiota bacterium]